MSPAEIDAAATSAAVGGSGNDAPATGDQVVPEAPKEEAVVQPSPEVSGQAGNEGEIARMEDYKRKLVGSTEEALRLKAENEALKTQLQTAPKAQTGRFDDSDIQAFRELADAAGYIPKGQIVTQEQAVTEKKQEVLNNFITSHPEYSKPGDKSSDVMWGSLIGEISDYIPAATPAAFAKQLEKAHRLVSSTSSADLEKGKALGLAEANLRGQGGQGNGSLGGSSQPSQVKKTPERQFISEGFASVLPQYYAKQ